MADVVDAVKKATDLVGAAATAAAPESEAPPKPCWAAVLLIVDVVLTFLLPLLDVLTDISTAVLLVQSGAGQCFASDGRLGLGRQDDNSVTIALALSFLAATAGGVGLVWLGVAAYRRWPRTFADSVPNKLRSCLKRLSGDSSTKHLCSSHDSWMTSMHALQLFLFFLEDVPMVVSAFFVASALPIPTVQLVSVIVSVVALCKTAAIFASLFFSQLVLGRCCCREKDGRFFLRCRVAACLVIFVILCAVVIGALIFALLVASLADGQSQLAFPPLRSRAFENSVGVTMLQADVGFVGASAPFASSSSSNDVWITKNSASLASLVAFSWHSSSRSARSKERFKGDLVWPFAKLLDDIRSNTPAGLVLVPDITGGPVLLAWFANACASVTPPCTNCSAPLPPGFVLLSRSFGDQMGQFFLPDCAFDPLATAPCSDTLTFNADNVAGLQFFCNQTCAADQPLCQTLATTKAAAPPIAWTRVFGKAIVATDCF